MSDYFQTIQSCPKAPCQHSSDRDTDIATLTADLAAERAERDSVETQCRHLRERICRLAANAAHEIVRLRAAGDALAEVADEWPELIEAWQRARK